MRGRASTRMAHSSSPTMSCTLPAAHPADVNKGACGTMARHLTPIWALLGLAQPLTSAAFPGTLCCLSAAWWAMRRPGAAAAQAGRRCRWWMEGPSLLLLLLLFAACGLMPPAVIRVKFYCPKGGGLFSCGRRAPAAGPAGGPRSSECCWSTDGGGLHSGEAQQRGSSAGGLVSNILNVPSIPAPCRPPSRAQPARPPLVSRRRRRHQLLPPGLLPADCGPASC